MDGKNVKTQKTRRKAGVEESKQEVHMYREQSVVCTLTDALQHTTTCLQISSAFVPGRNDNKELKVTHSELAYIPGILYTSKTYAKNNNMRMRVFC